MPPALTMAAYGLAGYAIPTRALVRSMPDKVGNRYDLSSFWPSAIWLGSEVAPVAAPVSKD